MAVYYIFIDETGSFQRTKNKSDDFVGGFVAKNFSYESVKEKIQEVSEKINSEIENEENHFDHNKHMHFIPLHIERDERREKEGINFPVAKASKLTESIFGSIKDNIAFIFRSKGYVKYFTDPESVYISLLISTLYQVIGEILKINETKDISLNIIIASRKEQKRDYKTDEKLISNLKAGLSEEIRKFDHIEFKLEIKKASDDIGLRIADFFCGSLRDQYSKKDYLKGYIRKEFPVQPFYYNVKSSLEIFRKEYESDSVTGVIAALEMLSTNKNELLEQELVEKIKPVIQDKKSELIEEINTTLTQYIILESSKYTKLDFYKKLIENIQKYVHSENQDLNVIIELLAQKYSIKLISHSGKTDLSIYEIYLENLQKNGHLIYKNRYSLLQEMLDCVLRITPISFNSFDFQKFESKINTEFENYKAVLPKGENIIDENMAKLEGTMGQMCAYLADMYKLKDQNQSNEYFENAEMYLLSDLKYCVPGQEAWEKVLGYLISFYFKNKNLEKCIEYFNLITKNTSINKIYNLSELNEFNHDFNLLQRLYICALSQQLKNTEISNLEYLKNDDNFQNNINNYPYCLSAKWLGVIYFKKSDYQSALEIFEKSSKVEKYDGFIIRLIKLSIRLLKYHTQIKINGSGMKNMYKNEIKIEIEKLNNHVEGIQGKLDSIGFNETVFDNYEDIFDLACIMPFNYA